MSTKPTTHSIIQTFEQLRICNSKRVIDLATALGIDASGWCKIKSGKRPFSFNEYVALCNFFSIPPCEPLSPDFDYRRYIKANNNVMGGANDLKLIARHPIEFSPPQPNNQTPRLFSSSILFPLQNLRFAAVQHIRSRCIDAGAAHQPESV